MCASCVIQEYVKQSQIVVKTFRASVVDKLVSFNCAVASDMSSQSIVLSAVDLIHIFRCCKYILLVVMSALMQLC